MKNVILESENGKDIWTVFTFINGNLVIEILKNVPQKNSISEVTTNPTGILTVADKKTGGFLYKIRPGSRDSSIFGAIKAEEKEIRITDKEIRFAGSVFSNNIISGFPVGIKIDKNGGIGIGTPFPPEFQRLIDKNV